MTDQHTGGDAVVDVLLEAGVEVVFGIPSVHNLPIYDSLRRRGGIRAITVRHEQGAAGAADGYARATGKLGVFVTSTGPGAANAMGGLLEGFVSGSPILHLTGQVETRFLDQKRGLLHEVPDQPAMLGSLSKTVRRAADPGDIARIVAGAVAEALAPPKGPVSVELPIDLQYAAAEPLQPGEIARLLAPARPPAPDAAKLQSLLTLVGESRRPLVLAGGGVVSSGAESEVAALCNLLGAGLITSPNGRGVLDEADPLCLGNLSWDAGVRDLLGEADLLLAIGTRFQGPNTENWKMPVPASVAIIDVEPGRPSRNYQPTVAVAGDAKEVVSALLTALDGHLPGSAEGWRGAVASARESARSRLRHVIGAQEGLLDELSGAAGPGTVIVKDATIPAYTWGNRLLPVRRPRTSIMPNGFAIGLGLPHAVGAGAACVAGDPGVSRPDSVVLMVGDGGVMLAVTELATLAAEQLPVLVLVFADGGYGILRNIQDKQYGEVSGRIGVELDRPDFVGLAKSLGVEAERVATTESFGKAVRAALATGRPYLVEVDLDAIGPMNRPYTGTSRPPQGVTKAG
ncbi:MAG: thiamine pyrophosphate-binding protein [Acidimicrobiales bacterium]